MQSLKCSQCNLVNFANSENCKRCGYTLEDSYQTQSEESFTEEFVEDIPRQKLATNCPRCDSNHTQSFQMAYQTGTSAGKLRIATYNAEIGIGVGSGNISNQTLLAGSLKPPIAPNSSASLAISLIVGIVSPFFLRPFLSEKWIILSSLLFISVPIFSGYLTFKLLTKDNAEKLKHFQSVLSCWSKSWICLKCGISWEL
jgi:hypothetical protein